MCSASGRATPGLLSQLAVSAARGIAFQHEQTLGRIRQIQNFGAHAAHRRVATPGRFTLTTFLCTLQPTTSADRLIRQLQHSILGPWLALTQAGSPPARHQTISSPHVHRFVLRFMVRCAQRFVRQKNVRQQNPGRLTQVRSSFVVQRLVRQWEPVGSQRFLEHMLSCSSLVVEAMMFPPLAS